MAHEKNSEISKGPSRWRYDKGWWEVQFHPISGEGVGFLYKGLSSKCYWNMRIEEALAHSSAVAHLATPRLVTTRCGLRE